LIFSRAVSVPPEKRVVFGSSVEGLFIKGLGARLTPELRERLKNEAQLDLARLQTAYDLATWKRALALTADIVHPGVPRDEAYERLGADLSRGFFDTFLGRAVHTVIKLIGPRRTLLRTERNLRSGNNYTECSFIEHAPNHIETVINEGTELRHAMTGVVREALLYAGAKNLKVQLLRFDDQNSTWDISWD
jgi:uncharacterized protein (TIGR02265 family)